MSHDVPAMPCIRCGDCADACPRRLQPQLLWQHARAGRGDRLVADGLDACVECGRCDAVCPSRLPLVTTFRAAKAGIAARTALLAQAAVSRARYEARGARLSRDAAERARRDEERKSAVATPDAVAAALARARAKRGAAPGDGT